MTVHTYFELLDANDGTEGLIELFTRSWERQGWQVRVLTRADVVHHPDYEQYLAAISRIPTANRPDFEIVCFLRYLAMLNVGGGLLVDMDVINYGYTPDMLPRGMDYTLQRGSGTFGSQYFYGWLCYEFANWTRTRVPVWTVNGLPHWSDMVFLTAAVPTIEVCLTCGQGNWEMMPLVHFSNGSLYYGDEMLNRVDRAQRILAKRPL